MKSFNYTHIREERQLGSIGAKLDAARTIFREHGLLALCRRAAIKIADPFTFLAVHVFGAQRFALGEKEHEYLRAWKFRTWNTERQVEIPLGLEFISKYSPSDVLEIGNVLHNYASVKHLVLDKYESAQGVLNEDIVSHSLDQKFGAIVCISTLEHVGRDETPREDSKAISGLYAIQQLLKENGQALITIPTGWNLPLEQYLTKGVDDRSIQVRGMRRESMLSQWKECTKEDALAMGSRYQVPFGASGVLVLNITGKSL